MLRASRASRRSERARLRSAPSAGVTNLYRSRELADLLDAVIAGVDVTWPETVLFERLKTPAASLDDTQADVEVEADLEVEADVEPRA